MFKSHIKAFWHDHIKKIFDIHENACKFTIFIALFLYVIILLNVSLMHFHTDDPVPLLQMISMEMRGKFRDFSALVKTGLYIKNFPTFDFEKNYFVIDALVWFEFNAHEMMLEAMQKFSFENSRILYKSPPDVRINGEKIFAKYNVTFELKTDLDFHRFPLGDHRLSLVLTNDFVSPNEMYFDDATDALSFAISPQVFVSNWKLHALNVQSGYSSISLDQYDSTRKAESPKVVYTIDFQKAGFKKILIIFVPLFAAAFFSLFVFLMNLTNHIGKFSLAITSVTALLGYRFVIEQISPQVGYFTTTDSLYIFFLLFAFSAFIFQLLLSRHMLLWMKDHLKIEEPIAGEEAIVTPSKLERANSYAFLLAAILFVLVVTYLIIG